MNKFFIFILFASFILTQTQNLPDVLNQIQKRAKSIKKKSNPNSLNQKMMKKNRKRARISNPNLRIKKRKKKNWEGKKRKPS